MNQTHYIVSNSAMEFIQESLKKLTSAVENHQEIIQSMWTEENKEVANIVEKISKEGTFMKSSYSWT